MKFLIVEDDFTARKLLQVYLTDYGDCFVAANGNEAVDAFTDALDKNEPYDMICLDIMMTEANGHTALRIIREMENKRQIAEADRVKVIMTTALSDTKHVMGAYNTGCEAYIVKPVRKEHLLKEMSKLGLVELSAG